MAMKQFTLEERFWRKVNKTDTCWLWTACCYPSGYGLLRGDRKNLQAHRVSWELANGPIPKGDGYHGTCVLHQCDVRKCVNPAHLFLGTNAENMKDMARKGRADRTRKLKGDNCAASKLTSDQVRAIRSAVGKHADIADQFGTCRANVSLIREGKTWRHLLT